MISILLQFIEFTMTDKGKPMAGVPQEPARLRGRPRQRESEVGRDKLIEQSRKVMQRRPTMDIQRREIADVVGVTPALINYYFPDKWTLLEAASYPVINDLVTTVEELLDSPQPSTQKIEDLIEIYLTFHSKSGYAMSYYIISSRKLKKWENFDLLKACRDRVYALIKEVIPVGGPEVQNAKTVHAMLWSVCECLARLPARRQEKAVEDGGPTNVRAHHFLVLDLFTRGVLIPWRHPRTSPLPVPTKVARIV